MGTEEAEMVMEASGGAYGLPVGYRRNLNPADFDAHASAGGHTAGWVWQPDVVPFAVELAREEQRPTLIDIGCGSGRQLEPYLTEFDVFGFDRPEIVDRITCPGTWWPVDLESEPSLLDMMDEIAVLAQDAVVICSDVVEHLPHPHRLVTALASLVDAGARLVLSTPDRDRTRGPGDMGPPANHHHVAEWTLGELVQWLTADPLNMTIRRARWTRSNSVEKAHATCLIVA